MVQYRSSRQEGFAPAMESQPRPPAESEADKMCARRLDELVRCAYGNGANENGLMFRVHDLERDIKSIKKLQWAHLVLLGTLVLIGLGGDLAGAVNLFKLIAIGGG